MTEISERRGSDAVEEFQCPVCFRLAVQPTTLACGHTSCRLCLAQWYFSSHKKECPFCREAYEGHPKINTQLRNMLMRLVPDDMQLREKEMSEDGEGMKIVANYDKELSEETQINFKKYSFLTSFCSGICVALCSVVVVYLAWCWQNSDNELLVTKPVETWKPKDVEKWLNEMPWAQSYAFLAREQEIDGKFLLSLDEKNVQRLLNVTDEAQLKALMFSLEILKEKGLKKPVTIWDYKAIYPGRSLFLLYGLRNFPRISFLYMYVYFYDELFLPFLLATTQGNSGMSSHENTSIQLPTTAMWSEFLFYIITVPQYPVILYAWQMFKYHTFTPLFVLVSSLMCCILDILYWKAFLIDPKWRSLLALLKMQMRHLIGSFGIMILWPVIPKFVADVFFYGTLYLSPVQLSMEFYHKLTHH